METNEKIKNQIFEIIKNQMKANTPPETNITYKRLIDLGYSDYDTKQFIGQCLAVELFNTMKYGKPFDKNRYIENLKKLPKEPFD